MLIDQPLSASKDGTNVHGSAVESTQLINEPRYQPIEKAKIALKRGFPWLEFTVHAASLTIIGALLWVHVSETFWRDFEVKKQRRQNMELKAWQFAAKVHELLMLASLSFVIFYYMRKLLVGRQGIPFGLVSAPHLTSSPGMLFKQSFWIGWGRNLPFGGLLFLACILSFTLGPSSAITMIPSLGWYEMKSAFWADSSTVLYNATAGDLWPTVFTQTMNMNATEASDCMLDPFNPLNLQCPTGGFSDILKWFTSLTRSGSRGSLLFTDLWSSVQRKVAIKIDHDSLGTSIYATVVTDLASRTLGSFYSYARRINAGGTSDVAYPRLRIKADTPLHQPIIFVKCSMSLWSQDPNRENISFPSVEGAWVQDSWYPQASTSYLDTDNEIFDGLPDKEARFSWYNDDNVNASSSLLALAIVPVVARGSADRYWTSAIVACSADARWAASDAYYQPTNSSTVSSNVSDVLLETESPYGEWILPGYMFSDKPLDLKPDWAAFFNGYQTELSADNSSSNMTSMAGFLQTAIDHREIDGSDVPDFVAPNVTSSDDKNGGIEETIAMLLGGVLADGIARGASDVFSFLKTNTTADDDVVTVLESPQNLFKWRPVPDFYSVRIKLDSYGYGYGLRNTAGWVAMIVLLLFTLTVLVHGVVLGCAVARRQYYGGECWENVAELMALAMNSTPSEKLDGTSAGVERSETWRNVVKIRETDGQCLELRFVDRYDEDGGRVIIGKKYM